MKKKLLLLLFLSMFSLLTTKNANAQFLHFGIKTFMSPVIRMSYYKYNATNYVFYFSNEYNETIRFGGMDSSQIKSLSPYPDIFLKYEGRNHFFARAELFAFWFKNEAFYKNSVDFSEYAEEYNPSSERPNLGYNSINLKWAFWGTSVNIGYKFFKAKALRPFLSLGLTRLQLISLKPGDYYQKEREVRNTIIFYNLSTFEEVTYYLRSGFGFQYHGIELEAFLQSSLGENLDINRNNEGEISLYNSGIPNYKSFATFNISLGINLYSINFIKNSEKRKVKELN